MLKHAVRDIIQVDLGELRAVASLPCTIAIALALGLGLSLGRPVWGLGAAFGAMSVGFGVFQTLGRSRNHPLLWASLGMGFSAAVGSLIPHNTPGLVLNALAVGLTYGY